ncbi:IclR family transcriptional regulator domain-containing protein [Saccharothrix syringae]|uniref:IclR family transcriptional regulator n=1 Tax=Saccharothrix syringae TaxID=103733 RepID=A0A5Q0H6E7_SACSY|nr:IclR family transcriptional regulator C-terminal domain-containing protein [Saccharothrix syringae]QFZ21729.1 IclR family transcriptional regulator [Saccharothrix syringae]
MTEGTTEGGTFERGLAVLHAVASAPGPRLRRGDLAKATGLPRATADRVTATLLRLGHLRAEGADVLLGLRSMALGNAYLASCGLVGTVGPVLARLADELDETVTLAVPDADGARLVAQSTRRRAVYLAFHVGDVLPSDRTAAGVVLAGYWDEDRFVTWRHRRTADPLDAGFPAVPALAAPVADREAVFRDRVAAARARGWALDDQWVEPGLLVVAAPVCDRGGRAVAAISVLSHTSRDLDVTGVVLPRLRAAVAEAEAVLGAAVSGAPSSSDDGGSAGSAMLARSVKDEVGMDFLETLARGLAVVEAFRHAPGGLSASAAAELTGLPRATARRALQVLCDTGYAVNDGGRFALLPAVLDLGYARLSRLTLAELAQPHLAGLAASLGESVSMAVLDGDDVRYVARAAATRVMRVDITVGTRFPAHATSMGRVLLADLPAADRAPLLRRAERLTRHTVVGEPALQTTLDEVARLGWALVEEELHEGLRSLAVGVRDRAGRVVAAVNTALHVGGVTPGETVERVLPALRRTVGLIEADLAVAFDQVPLVVH